MNLPATNWEAFKRLPDKGVLAFVTDVLENLDVDTKKLPEHWIPIGVLGALDWIVICGWWIFRNTGLYQSDLPYKYIFDFLGYEFDPDKLEMFLEDPSKNYFKERLRNPGLEDIERGEALQFILQDTFGGFAKSKGEPPSKYTPPSEFCEYLLWATFMWVLSKHGRDWIYQEFTVAACVFDYGVAYLSKWESSPTLLDPGKVTKLDRPTNSCANCGEVLWCTKGYLREDNLWKFYCANCANDLHKASEIVVLGGPNYITDPPCPFLKGTCSSTCPHSGMTPEKRWKDLEEKGSNRLKEWRERIHAMGGENARVLSGQSEEEVLKHFRGE